MNINIDFETRSAVDLINSPKAEGLAGLYNYATDPSTDILCMWYSVDGAEPVGWHPGEPPPAVFDNDDFTAHAWNADFERLIWHYIMVEEYDFRPIELDRWRCTAFAARCNNLPNKLENAARCLRIEQQKSARGRELIKLLSLPMADGTFLEDADLMAEMDDYCAQDVRAEMGVKAMLREPTDEEWADYHTQCRINDRGVRVDIPLCIAAQQYAGIEEEELIERIEQVTEGVVTKARGENLKAWVLERLTPEQEQLLVKYRNGERKLSLDKYNRARLLELDDIDPDVREVVECSDFAQKSSVGKFKAMQRLADPMDERVRGALMCNGAAESGRYSSKGAQVHNFPRDVMPDPEEVRADLVEDIIPEDMIDYYKLPMMTILSRSLRSALIPAPGKEFLVSDWSAIEGRVAPWLCDNPLGEAKLQLYRDDAPVYEIAAAATFHCNVEDVTSAQRQIGKVEELSFQYQGGAAAFLAMARNYGISASTAEATKYRDAWRQANPWAVKIWGDIERAAWSAMKKPGVLHQVGRLAYFTVEDVLCGGKTLFCQLPCGRVLTYPDARVEILDSKFGPKPQITVLRAAFVPKVGDKEWPRTGLYGGKLFNNAVQGTAASLLRYVVREVQDSLRVVLHVHDELVAETVIGDEHDSRVLEHHMNTPPAWAAGLPLKAEVKRMQRFGK